MSSSATGGRSSGNASATGVIRDRGSASLWLVGFAAVIWLVAAAIVACGLAIAARHRASTAADLAALAAAAAVARASPVTSNGDLSNSAEPACARALTIAKANGARLARCDFVDRVVVVVTRIQLHGLAQLGSFTTGGVAAATARAGPG